MRPAEHLLLGSMCGMRISIEVLIGELAERAPRLSSDPHGVGPLSSGLWRAGLRPRFEDEVEGGLGGASEVAEASFGGDLA
jgi:hypothetical protein